MAVEYIPYKNIDKKKWDDCIASAANGLIYARSFYLDNIAENWNGLILNDYEAVMPLTWKKKWGIRYLYQPAFIQQGGVFFTKQLTTKITHSFIELLTQHFYFAEITLNFANCGITTNTGISFKERDNFIISLQKPYQEVFKNYHPNFTKSLRRIKKFELVYSDSKDVDVVMQLYKKLYSKKLVVSKNEIDGFINACKQLSKEKNLVIRNVHSKENELLATALLLKDEKRLYNMISCITDAGKKLEANYFLYDQIISEFSSSQLLLDMEGSDRKGIAGFYKKLNPFNQPYPFLKFNHLPAVVKLFKK